MTADERELVCAECGVTFQSERSDAEAHAEAVKNFGQRGDAPGMVLVCDECYEEIMRRISS